MQYQIKRISSRGSFECHREKRVICFKKYSIYTLQFKKNEQIITNYYNMLVKKRIEVYVLCKLHLAKKDGLISTELEDKNTNGIFL